MLHIRATLTSNVDNLSAPNKRSESATRQTGAWALYFRICEEEPKDFPIVYGRIKQAGD